MTTSDAVVLDHEHGVINNRCAHPDCRAAFARWGKQWKHDKHRGIARMADAAPARIHIATLEGAGWSRRSIAAAAGTSPQAISRIVHGQKTLKPYLLQAILAVSPETYATRPAGSSSDLFVPRMGTVRRIQALLAIGWTHRHISECAGVTTAILLHQQGRWVTRSTHDKIAAAYRELSGRSGPSPHTRGRAKSLGYLSPMHWDDIDTDPEPATDDDGDVEVLVDEVVVQRFVNGDDRAVKPNRAEKVAIVARWRELGRPLRQLEQFGWYVQRYYTPDREDQAS